MSMRIETVDFVEGAKDAQGVVVVIDVFRAFSVACYAFSQGALKIFPIGTVKEAFALKDKIQGSVLVGERGGKKLEGFDYGNSPTEIERADLSGKSIVQTTHAGTKGLVNVKDATVILTGAFVNAKATVRYIKSVSPSTVSLVRMGLEGRERSDEDDLCAKYFESLLDNQPFEIASVKATLRTSRYSQRFFDPQKPWSPESDFDLCLDIDRFDFALKAEQNIEGHLCLNQVFI